MSTLILLPIDGNDNDRIIKMMDKTGFKSKKKWINWAIKRQLDESEKALKKIQGTAIDESGVPSLPEYVEPKEKEFSFILHDGSERRGCGLDARQALASAGINSYEEVLDFNEVL